jgi:hypothetical protein
MTHTKDEALKLAAEFDKRFTSMNGIDVPERVSVPRDEWRALHDAIKQALAAPTVQEPVAWRVKWPAIGGGHKWIMVDKPLMEKEGFVNEALYTTPPAKPAPAPLTDEQIEQIYKEQTGSFIDDSPWALMDFVRAIEAAHGITKGQL